MLDTHAVARSLTDAEFTPAQADAITAAVRQAAEHGDHVTVDRFDAGVAALDGRLERFDGRLDHLEARIDRIESRMDRIEARLDRMIWGFAGLLVAQTFAVIGAVFALPRFFPAP